MSAAIRIEWEIPPDVLAQGVEAYGDRVWQAVLDTAEIIRAELESRARDEAPWTDRTGNARSGLFSEYVIAGRVVEIFLAHSEDYGIFLETARGGIDAILWPTIEATFPMVFDTLHALLGI